MVAVREYLVYWFAVGNRTNHSFWLVWKEKNAISRFHCHRSEAGSLLLLLLFFYIHSIPKIYLFLAFQVTKRVAYLFLAASLIPKIPRNTQVTSVKPEIRCTR